MDTWVYYKYVVVTTKNHFGTTFLKFFLERRPQRIKTPLILYLKPKGCWGWGEYGTIGELNWFYVNITNLNNIFSIHPFLSNLSFFVDRMYFWVRKFRISRSFQTLIIEYFRDLSVTDRGKKILFIPTNSIVKILLVFRIIWLPQFSGNNWKWESYNKV